MSKNTANLGTSIKPGLLREVDSIRAEIPRSRIVERALKRFMVDFRGGKISLLETEEAQNDANVKVEGRGAHPTKGSANNHSTVLTSSPTEEECDSDDVYP